MNFLALVHSSLYRLAKDVRGQDLIEYALMAGFVAVRHWPGSRTMPHRVLSKLGLALKSAAKPLPLMRPHAA